MLIWADDSPDCHSCLMTRLQTVRSGHFGGIILAPSLGALTQAAEVLLAPNTALPTPAGARNPGLAGSDKKLRKNGWSAWACICRPRPLGRCALLIWGGVVDGMRAMAQPVGQKY